MEQQFRFDHIMNTGSGQDGAICGGFLFRFDAKGICNVFSLADKVKVSSFTLDKADVIAPHSNAVCFGCEYFEQGDEFPLLYTNIYNNYRSAQDRLEGIVCVYRVVREDFVFLTKLVQIIRVGFVQDPLWKSCDRDVRPYGNFVVDTDEERLYAFTMRDEDQVTRYFEMRLPKVREGVLDEGYGVNVVTLGKEDLMSWFDCEYSRYIQGACYHDHMIFSVEGFSDAVNPARMQVIDLKQKKQKTSVNLRAYGLETEPEFVEVYEGTYYYSDASGKVFTFTL